MELWVLLIAALVGVVISGYITVRPHLGGRRGREQPIDQPIDQPIERDGLDAGDHSG